MSLIQADSLANGVAAAAVNTAFLPESTIVPTKVLIIGTYDPLKTAIVDDVPFQIASPEDAGDKTGFGFMIERLARRAFLGTQGEIPVFVVPQSETGVVAAGEIDFVGTTGVLAGTVKLYISGDLVASFTVADEDTADEVATKCAAAINAIKELPVTATALTTVATLESKSKGLWGNDITIELNLEVGDVLPTGVTAAVTPMAAGTTVPDISTALDGLGVDEDANEAYFTELIHGYGLDSDTLDAVSVYVGEGNTLTGLYDPLVDRPFRSLNGDNATGSAGLTAAIVITDARLEDRANGMVSVPGSPSHPAEIAASAIGELARINNIRAEESYTDITLRGVRPGALADRWTNTYLNRDTAVKSGVSPTIVVGGAVKLQNVVSFYRPVAVAPESNGYRSMRDISITRNILASTRRNFLLEKWLRISIVSDVSDVTNVTDRLKARDVTAVRNDLVALITDWASRAWLFSTEFPLAELKKSGSIVVRSGGTGFDFTTRLIYAGEGGILNGTVEFDINLSAALSS